MNRINRLLITCQKICVNRYFSNSSGSNFSSSTKFDLDRSPEAEDSISDNSFTGKNTKSYASTDNKTPKTINVVEEDIFLDPTLTDEEKKRLKLYQQEYTVWKYADSAMPDHVTNDHWKIILKIDSRPARIRYLTFIETVKRRQARDERRRERMKQEALARRQEREASDTGHLIYAIGHNTFFRRLEFDSIIKTCYYPRLAYAMLHGPHIVFDASFVNHMTIFQQSLTAKQMWMLFDMVKVHKQPAHICITGVDRHAHWYHLLKKHNIDGFPITITERNYTDLFPKNRLIYLSPTATEYLPGFDANKIYIVGAIVDKGETCADYKHATLGKAKAENIQAYKLPMDLYVKFQKGSKYLCLNHMTNIILDMFVHKDWHKAFVDNIPQRKLTPFDPERTSAILSKQRKQMNKERDQFLQNMVENMKPPQSVS